MFMNSLQYFRGVAILAIVAGHVYVGDLSAELPTITNLIAGSTALFVFISGYLFQYLITENFSYFSYLNTKLKFVITPYLICSLPAIIYIAVRGNFHPLLGDVDAVTGSIYNLFTGRHVTAYWYIPFAVLLFLCAPAAVYFARLKNSWQLIILAILSLISLLSHRPIGGMNPFHALIFYMPIYLFGIYCAVEPKRIQKLKNYNLIFLLSAVLLAYYQGEVTGHLGSYHKALFQYSGIDLMYLQKVCVLLFIMTSLHYVDKKRIMLLEFFVKVSFPIYFIHGYVIVLLDKLSLNETLLAHGFNSINATLLKFILVVFISSILAISVKIGLGNRSRYVIGG